MSHVPRQRAIRPAPDPAWIAAAGHTALASAAFSVTVALVMVALYAMDRRDDPLALNGVPTLKSQLLARPTDESLKRQIRQLDRIIRESHFQRRAAMARGGFLLVGGIAVLLLCLKYRASRRRGAIDPLSDLPAAVDPLISAPLARRAVGIVAVVLGAAMGALALTPGQRFELAAIPASPTTAPTWPTTEELARNWPSMRGSAAGVVKDGIPLEWDGPSGQNILWKTPVPPPGHNSPVVWNGKVLLSGATKERQELYCIDADTGSLLWQKSVGNPLPGRAPKVMDDTGYAPSTMATDGQRAFAIFPNGDLAAVDLSGQAVWSKNLGMPENQYGHASSLAMWRDRLIIQYDQGLEPEAGKSALLALDAATGRTIWRTPRPVANSWTSPIVIATAEGDQIITAANPWVIAYEPANGRELWRAKCLEGDVAPSPAWADGMVFVAQEGAKASAIKLGGSGDVTSTHLAWSAEQALPDIVSPLATGRLMLTVTSIGTVTCYSAAAGTKLWDHDLDGPFHASPLLIGNVVYLISRNGVMSRFEAADQFKPLSDCALGEAVSATPAVVADRIYIRGEKNLYCIGSKR